MFGWFAKKAQSTVAEAATNDLSKQLYMLRNSNADDVGLTLASATFWRLFWIQEGMIPKGAMSIYEIAEPGECARFRSNLIRQIEEDKKTSPAGVIGLMVWLNTSWSLSIHELRPLGRELWKELARGIPYAPTYVPNFLSAANVVIDTDFTDAVRFIPPGLEPE